MKTLPNSCPVCHFQESYRINADTVECPRCGRYQISDEAVSQIENYPHLYPLSAWIRNNSETGFVPQISVENVSQLKDSLPQYRVSEKQILLMRAFELRSNYPGQVFNINLLQDYPLAWAQGSEEFTYLITDLTERGLITASEIFQEIADEHTLENRLESYAIKITSRGWTFLEEHSRSAIISKQAFIAMSFSEELTSAYTEGMKPALAKAGFTAYRTDFVPHLERIDLKIMAEIKNSRFVVADVTKASPNVYFEAGYALGLNLPVIWCVQKADAANIRFDTRQYNHLVWESEQDLSEQLYYFVSALIGKA